MSEEEIKQFYFEQIQPMKLSEEDKERMCELYKKEALNRKESLSHTSSRRLTTKVWLGSSLTTVITLF